VLGAKGGWKCEQQLSVAGVGENTVELKNNGSSTVDITCVVSDKAQKRSSFCSRLEHNACECYCFKGLLTGLESISRVVLTPREPCRGETYLADPVNWMVLVVGGH
jgi:hypothetical protein